MIIYGVRKQTGLPHQTRGRISRVLVGLFLVVATFTAAESRAATAEDDVYQTQSGALLEIEDPGVMENDHDGGGEPPAPPMSVAHLDDDVNHGVLFLNGDGSFNYTSDPGFVGVDTFTYHFVDGTATSNTATVTITVAGCEPGVGPSQWVCWVEQAYLAKAAELGLTAVVESFEDGVTWGAVRAPATAPSVTSQNITWESNFPVNGITTGNGPARSGAWGVYSLPHGDQSGALTDLIRDGFTGTASVSDALLGVGGWLVASQIGSRVELIVTHDGGATTTAPFPDATLLVSHQFFGFIDTAGFTSFEIVETDGTVNQPYFVFGDDFSFLVAGADTTPPQVVEIGSWEDTGDDVLSEGESTDLAITEVMVRFSESVKDPAGNTDPDDVTNPANYLLFDDGGDGFDTVDCAAGVAGGDNPITVESVDYVSGSPSETTLGVNGGIGLPEGSYRLLVCGTTSIVDWADNPLDGDGNGTGGDDFVRNFTITGNVNHPPVADPQSVSTPEDTALAITLTGSDPDGDPLSFFLGTGPSQGALSGTLPNLTYTPFAEYNGPDSFTFEVEDADLVSISATVTIDVLPVNDVPTVDDLVTTTPTNMALPITMTGSDIDGDFLTFATGTGPIHGVLTGTPPNVSYSANTGYTGADSFTYTAYDGTVSSAAATVSISVTAFNSVPLAVGDSRTTDEDTAISIAVLGNDELGDEPTTITAVTQGTKGAVVIDPGATSVTYTPNLDTTGADSFTYTITDADLEESTATVSMTVSPVNDAPVADAGADQTVFLTDTVTLDGSGSFDVEGSPLTYAWSLSSVPPGSAASLSDPTAIMPTFVIDLMGAYVAELIVSDGTLFSAADTVTISTDNSPPIADAGADRTAVISETVSLDGSGSSDIDGDPLTFAWSFASVPPGSTASLSDPTALMPTFVIDVTGTYIARLVVSDGTASSPPDTVTISTVNSAPVADAGPDQSAFVSATITLDGTGSSDPDGDFFGFNWSLSSVPAGSTAALSNPSSFMPTFVIDLAGDYVVQLITFDGSLYSIPDTVLITTANAAPVADPQSLSTPENTGLGITLTGSDANGDAITFEVATGPTRGALTGTSPNLTYTPFAGTTGPDGFTFRAFDGTAYSDPATISINVLPVNDAPTADDQSVSTPEDTALAITLTGDDADGDALTFVIWTGPTHGVLSGTPPNVTYTPTTDYRGADSFTFFTTDSLLSSPLATVSITVTAANDAPTAAAGADQTAFVTDTVSLDGSGSSDVNGDPLTYAWSFSSVPPSSAAALSDPTAVMPTFVVDLPGSYVVQLIVHDGTVPSTPDTVTISTNNSAPVADAQSVSTPEDTALGIVLTGSDPDGDPITIAIGTGPTHGALTGTPPSVTYTPGSNYYGPDGFTFTATDGVLTSPAATVSITVTPVNDVPLAVDDSASTDEDVGVSVAVLTNDALGDPPTTITSVTQSVSGSVVIDPGATSVTYTPDVDFHGIDAFSYIITDADLQTSTATVSMTVNPVNDVPLAGDDSSTTDEDTAISISVFGNDNLGDEPTTITSVTQGTKGAVAIDPGATTVTYTPEVDFHGADNFTYTVTDADLETSIATVSMTVTPVNDAPTADAGPGQTAFVTDTVTLDGSGSSDVDGDLLTHAWTFSSVPPGSTASLSDPTAVMPTFVIDIPGDYVVELIVDDGVLPSTPDSVTISIDNSAPVADAGPDQSAFVTDTVALDGTGSSDADGDPLSYAWSFTSAPVGSTAVLSDPSAVLPTFVIDLPGDYVVELIVDDGALPSVPDTVTISTDNSAPDANAGPDQSAFVTDTVILDGTGSSDADGDPLSYAWSFTSAPVGSTASLSDPTAEMPTFVVDLPGSYVVQLIVHDGTVPSAPDTVTISTDNSVPVADPKSVSTAEDTVLGITLTGSDPDGDPITFAIGTGPTHGVLTGTPPSVTYTPGSNYHGPDGFTFTATDGVLTSPAATVSMTVDPVNDAPTADAGPDQTALVTDTVTLNGTGSSDLDGDPLTYAWSFTSVPLGSTAVLSDPTAEMPTFVVDLSGSYVVQLIVQDGTVPSAPATVSITVTPTVDPVLRVGDASLIEPDAGTIGVVVTITVSEASPSDITVEFATADGSALAGFDYVAASGSVIIPAFATSHDVMLDIVGDVLDEPDEAFAVNLANPVGATLGSPWSATVTIFDNDPMAELSAVDLTVGEAVGTAEVALQLNGPSGFEITVDYVTVDGNASAPGDYGAVSGTAIITSGSTSTNVSIPIVDDTEVESGEGFTLDLSLPNNAVLLTPSIQVTILDDDGCAIPGDADGNCLLDAADLSLIITVIDDPSVPVLGNADCDASGTVDGWDLACVAASMVAQ